MKKINFDKKTMLVFSGLLFAVLTITIIIYCCVKGKSPQEINPLGVKKENKEMEFLVKQKEDFNKLTQRIINADFHKKVNEIELRQSFVARGTKFSMKIDKIDDMNILKNYMKSLETKIKNCEKELKAFENKTEEDEDYGKKLTLEDDKKEYENEYKVCKDKEKLFTKKDNDATKQVEIDKELQIFIATIALKNEIHNLNKLIETEKDETFKQVLIKQKDLFTQMIK